MTSEIGIGVFINTEVFMSEGVGRGRKSKGYGKRFSLRMRDDVDELLREGYDLLRERYDGGGYESMNDFLSRMLWEKVGEEVRLRSLVNKQRGIGKVVDVDKMDTVRARLSRAGDL